MWSNKFNGLFTQHKSIDFLQCSTPLGTLQNKLYTINNQWLIIIIMSHIDHHRHHHSTNIIWLHSKFVYYPFEQFCERKAANKQAKGKESKREVKGRKLYWMNCSQCLTTIIPSLSHQWWRRWCCWCWCCCFIYNLIHHIICHTHTHTHLHHLTIFDNTFCVCTVHCALDIN